MTTPSDNPGSNQSSPVGEDLKDVGDGSEVDFIRRTLLSARTTVFSAKLGADRLGDKDLSARLMGLARDIGQICNRISNTEQRGQ